MNFIYVNGGIFPENEARISVSDRSYLFGEGLFETFRSHDGKIPLLPEHLKRLQWAALLLALPFPTDVDFKEVCEELLERNALPEARFKIVLSQNEKTENSSKNEDCANLVIFCTPLPSKTVTTFRLKIIKNFVNDALPLSAMKTTSYLVKLMGRHEAQDAGYDDGILLNAKGNVTEATTGNLFWVDEKGVLRTIAEAHGLLRGVMKQELMKLIQEKKLVCREDAVTPTDLSNAREVFLTNSVVGIKPVSHIDHRRISGGEAGDVTRMLMDLWGQKLKDML